MMGVWFLAASVGNYIGGRMAAFYEAMPLCDALRCVAAFGVARALMLPAARQTDRDASRAKSDAAREVQAEAQLHRARRSRPAMSRSPPGGRARHQAERHDSSASRSTSPVTCTTTVSLEHNGVLLSWAVPKGPSLDPTIKRLAMHVEDHPVEYGEFEGVIPSGYGAGIVMLWDRGTWTPEVDDVDAALQKGDLKFTLDGYKLKGSWVLVRTRGWGSVFEGRVVAAHQAPGRLVRRGGHR